MPAVFDIIIGAEVVLPRRQDRALLRLVLLRWRQRAVLRQERELGLRPAGQRREGSVGKEPHASKTGGSAEFRGEASEGISYLGPLPAEVQMVTVFSAGVHTAAPAADAGAALLKFLTSPRAAPVLQRHGMEPG